MAKAKTGLQASATTDKESVGQAVKKLIGMIALVSVATVAKLNAENNYLGSWMGGQSPPPAQSSQRFLKAANPGPIMIQDKPQVKMGSYDDYMRDVGEQYYNKKFLRQAAPQPVDNSSELKTGVEIVGVSIVVGLLIGYVG